MTVFSINLAIYVSFYYWITPVALQKAPINFTFEKVEGSSETQLRASLDVNTIVNYPASKSNSLAVLQDQLAYEEYKAH